MRHLFYFKKTIDLGTAYPLKRLDLNFKKGFVQTAFGCPDPFRFKFFEGVGSFLSRKFPQNRNIN
jgi:hypothetical protein